MSECSSFRASSFRVRIFFTAGEDGAFLSANQKVWPPKGQTHDCTMDFLVILDYNKINVNGINCLKEETLNRRAFCTDDGVSAPQGRL